MDYLTKGIPLNSAIKPALFLVAHFIYFGVPFVFALVNYKSFYKCMCEGGMGMFLIALWASLQTVDSETRRLQLLIPFLVLAYAQMCERLKISNKFALLLFFGAFITSRCWFPINANTRNFNHYEQAMFINWGPWIGLKNYLIFLAVMVVLIVFFKWHAAKSKSRARKRAQQLKSAAGRFVDCRYRSTSSEAQAATPG
jgi:hypothetical protein